MSVAYDTILWDPSPAPVGRIVLNRPEKRNPIGPRTCGELVHALGVARAEATIQCVVLTGAGPVFSSGGDLAQMAGAGGRPDVPPASLPQLFAAMHALEKPLLAVVNGHAMAGGLGLVAACDLAIASEAAELGTPEINVGLWPMMISAELVRCIGRRKTLELALLGERISAREAERIGLVNRVVPADRIHEEGMALARTLAQKSPAAARLGLRALYATEDLPYAQAIEHLQQQFTAVVSTEDAAEGIAAFLDKRPPRWRGR